VGKFIKIDFTEFNGFKEKLENLKTKKLMLELLFDKGNRFLKIVKLKTPKKSGKLTRGWKLSKISNSSDVFKADVKNDVDYASSVEYGHSQKVGMFIPIIGKRTVKPWVFGKFMMRNTIAEIKDENQIKKRIILFFKEGVNGK